MAGLTTSFNSDISWWDTRFGYMLNKTLISGQVGLMCLATAGPSASFKYGLRLWDVCGEA